MLNELGKELRKLRIDHNERILDMAKKINRSSAFVSSIERGQKPIPDDFDNLIINAYRLVGKSAENIRQASARSKKSFKLNPSSDLGKDTASLMARRINELSPDQFKNILKILENKK